MSGEPYGIALSSTGTIVATRLAAGTLAMSTLGEPTSTDTVQVGAAPTGVALSPAGTQALVTNQFSRSLGVVDIASRVQTSVIPLGNDPFVVTYSPDGERAYVSTNVGMVYAIDVSARTVVDSVFTGHGSNGLAFSPDKSRLYVSAFVAGAVYEVNLASFDVSRTFNTGGSPQGLVVSPDGAELYAANEAGWLDIWDLASGARRDSVALPSAAFGLAMSPDGTRLAVGLNSAGRVLQLNRQSRVVMKDHDIGGNPRRLQYSATGKTLVVANLDGWIDLIQ
jgi:YVTN family beta-propeller protein